MDFLRKFKRGRPQGEIVHDVMDNLRLLAEAERMVAKLYELCADVFEDERDFWTTMSRSEVTHAEHIGQMIDLVSQSPGEYEPGHAFSPAAIRTFHLYLESLMGRIGAGTVAKDELLRIAADIEDTAVELEYGNMVRTNNHEFNALVGMIAAESRDHREAVAKRVPPEREPEPD